MRHYARHYPESLKLKVVEEYLTTDISMNEIREKYFIKGVNVVRSWIRKFEEIDRKEKSGPTQIAMTKTSSSVSREKELEAKLKEAEKALEHERLRNLALSTMIDVAEREFNIPIRKKPGSKQ